MSKSVFVTSGNELGHSLESFSVYNTLAMIFEVPIGELPKPDNPGDRDWLGPITQDTGTVRSRKDTFHRHARGIGHSRFEFVRL